ncbi:OmpA family protein [Qipengyuania sp. ASV99]
MGLALGAALLIAGCAGGDRVTLLSHSDGGPDGAIAVLGEGGEETVLDRANLQATLTGGRPRLRELAEADPNHVALMAGLPPPPAPLILMDFPFGEFSLSAAQIASIRAHLSGLEGRPGYQIEIRGYTDSTGEEPGNRILSQDRADRVAEIVRNEGFVVAQEDVVGMSEFEAIRENGDGRPDPSFRRVEVVIR